MSGTYKIPMDGIGQEVLNAMSVHATQSKEDKVLNLFKKYTDDAEALPVIWSAFRQTAIQSFKTANAVIDWIETSSVSSRTFVANLLNLEISSVSEELVQEFVLSQLLRPLEKVRAESIKYSEIRNAQKPKREKLVTLVMQALTKEKRLTFLTKEKFKKSSFFDLLSGYLPNGSPMKDQLAPDRIQPKDIAGLLLKLQDRVLSKMQTRKRNKRSDKEILSTKLSLSEIVDTMQEYFGVVKATKKKKKINRRTSRVNVKGKKGATKRTQIRNGSNDDGKAIEIDKDASDNCHTDDDETKRSKGDKDIDENLGNVSGDCANGGNSGTIVRGTDVICSSSVVVSPSDAVDASVDVSRSNESKTRTAEPSRPTDNAGLAICCKCQTENPKLECLNCSQGSKPKKENHNWGKLLLMHQEHPETTLVTEHPPSVLLQAVSLVYPELVRMLNEHSQSLDLLLKSGRKGRRMLNLPNKPPKQQKMTATCSPVASNELKKKFLLEIQANNGKVLLVSPMVISLEGVFSKDFKEAYLNVVDQLRFCKDKSGSGGSCNRASIYRPQDDPVVDEDGIFVAADRLLPLIKLGLKNAIQAIEATRLESVLHEIQAELANLFIDAVQETIERINGTGSISDVPNWKKQFESLGTGNNDGELEQKEELEGAESGQSCESCDEDEDADSTDAVYEDLIDVEPDRLPASPGAVGTRASKRLATQPSIKGQCIARKRKAHKNNAEGRSNKRLKTQQNNYQFDKKRNRKQPRDHAKIKRKGSPRRSAAHEKKSRLRCLAERGLAPTLQKFLLKLRSKSFFGGSKKRTHPKLPRFKCNIMIIKCGNEASYGDHQDGSGILNSDSLQFNTRLADATRLPTACEMMVPTIVLAREDYSFRTKLVHSRGGSVLSQVTTGNNSAHIQSPGCNSFGIQHKSAAIKEKGKRSLSLAQNAARCVFTGRTGIDPKHDEDCYKVRILEDDLSHSAIKSQKRKLHLYNTYDQHNVTRSRATKTHPGKGGKCVPLWEYQETLTKSVALPAIPKAKTFSQMSREDWDSYFKESDDGIQGMSLPPRMLAIKPNSKADIVANYKTTRHFLEKGKIIHLLDAEGRHLPLQPLHTDVTSGGPLPMGVRVCRDDIPLSFTAYSNDTIDPKYPNIFVLHHQYKNVPEGINQHIKFYEKLGRLHGIPEEWAKIDMEKLRQEYNNLPSIFICGSGGSSQKAGSKNPTANATIDEPTYTIGQPQTVQSEENIALLHCEERQNSLALMVDLEQWRKPIPENGKHEENSGDEEGDEEGDDSDQDLWDEEAEGDDENEEEEETPPIYDKVIMAQLDRTEDLFFMNYYHVKQSRRREKLQPSEIQKRFAHLPSYPVNEHDNLSYLRHKHFEFELEKSFDFDTVMKFFEPNTMPSKLQVVAEGPILVDSKGSQVSAFNRLEKKEKKCICSMFPKTGTLPEDWVTREEMIDHFIELEEEAMANQHKLSKKMSSTPKVQKNTVSQSTEIDFFEKAIGAQPLGSNVLLPDRRYRVETKDLIPVVVAMMASSAVRFDKAASTKTSFTEKGGKFVPSKLYATPPLTFGVDRLPDPVRRCARPCPNPDADVSACHFRSNASIFLRERKLEKIKEFHTAFKTPDLTDRYNCETVAECMLMAIFSRLTGKITMLHQFTEWIKLQKNGKDPCDGRCLPTSDSVDDFIDFLCAHKGSGGSEALSPFVSQQHAGAIPKVFLAKRRGKIRFCAFLKRFADRDNEGGMRSLIDYLQFAALEGGLGRGNLRDVIGMAINACSGAQMGRHLDFLVHKAISDVESIFPGLAGKVNTSSIGFGTGSRIGLRILTRDIKRMSDVGRFDHVYNQVMKSLESVDDTTLLAMGYKRVKRDHHKNMIVSWLTGRELSRTDVEHWCCKVYICMNACHPSRTISENPKCYSAHCWPLPISPKWVEDLEDYFKMVWGAFLKLEPTYLSKRYPAHLRFLPSTRL